MSLRIALFTHDTFGLGHVRRCLRIMRSIARAEPDAAQLLITGSPAVGLLGELPPNTDYVKVPTTVKTGARGNQPPHLPIPPAERNDLRTVLIRDAVLGFAPDVLVVDNFPLGSQGELLPTLRALRATRTRTVLGLRDVLDAPEIVQDDWRRQGIYDVLDRYYDRILVYGMREVLDAATAYALSPASAAKVRYCGYITDSSVPPQPAAIRARFGDAQPLLLATGGGGGDAYPLLQLFVDAVKLLPASSAVVVTGPLMGSEDRERLRATANGHSGVEVLEYTPDLPSWLAAADVVVSMCGYNSAVEIAALGARAVVVPRTWRYGEHQKRQSTIAELEQLLRARALAALGCVQMLEPESATPARLAAAITAELARPRNALTAAIDLNGLQQATSHVLELARSREVMT